MKMATNNSIGSATRSFGFIPPSSLWDYLPDNYLELVFSKEIYKVWAGALTLLTGCCGNPASHTTGGQAGLLLMERHMAQSLPLPTPQLTASQPLGRGVGPPWPLPTSAGGPPSNSQN